MYGDEELLSCMAPDIHGMGTLMRPTYITAKQTSSLHQTWLHLTMLLAALQARAGWQSA